MTLHSPGAVAAPTVAEFDHVVVANGHYNVPRVPDVAGLDRFRGEVQHSSSFRTAEPYAGKRVVVVGDGPSALDIGQEVARLAASVCISTRGIVADVDRPKLSVPVTWVPQIVGCDDDGSLRLADGCTFRHVRERWRAIPQASLFLRVCTRTRTPCQRSSKIRTCSCSAPGTSTSFRSLTTAWSRSKTMQSPHCALQPARVCQCQRRPTP